MSVVWVVTGFLVLVVVVIIPVAGVAWLFHVGGGAFDDFVQFTFVEPDSSAFGAIINFNSLFIGHYKGFVTIRAIHK